MTPNTVHISPGKLANETKSGKIRGHTLYLKQHLNIKCTEADFVCPKSNSPSYERVHYTATNGVPVSIRSKNKNPNAKIQSEKCLILSKFG